jgi:hypothetical protein
VVNKNPVFVLLDCVDVSNVSYLGRIAHNYVVCGHKYGIVSYLKPVTFDNNSAERFTLVPFHTRIF